MIIGEFGFQFPLQHLHFFQYLVFQVAMYPCWPDSLDNIHELWIFTLVVVEFERLLRNKGIEDVSYHWSVVKVPFRVKGDFKVWVGFFPLVVSQYPVIIIHNPRISRLLIVPGVESSIAFQIILATSLHAVSQRDGLCESGGGVAPFIEICNAIEIAHDNLGFGYLVPHIFKEIKKLRPSIFVRCCINKSA